MPCFFCYQRKYDLLPWEQLPEHLKHNQYIIDEYRVGISFYEALQSIFHWHNETLNIWTHLMGVIMFTLLLITSSTSWFSSLAPLGIFFTVLYFFSSLFMLGASTMFHTFCCMSAAAYNALAKTDYLGIAIQIMGSYGFIAYHLFQCNYLALFLYIGLVLVLGTAVIYVTLYKNIHTPGLEKQRLGLFLGFGFSVAICGPHAIVIHGWPLFSDLLWRVAVMGSLYVVGSMIYGFQIPERFYPEGKFVPPSHAIWHCFVLAAALFHCYTCFWLSQTPSFGASCRATPHSF